MNYRKVYMAVIAKAMKEHRQKLSRDTENYVYYEEHHILPKSLFPAWKNRKSNLVLLTAREHFFCHQLLKIYSSYSMACALFYMCNGNEYQRAVCSSRDYERARIEFSKWNSIKHKGQKAWNKGQKCPQFKSPTWMHTKDCQTKRIKTIKKNIQKV